MLHDTQESKRQEKQQSQTKTTSINHEQNSLSILFIYKKNLMKKTQWE